MDKKLQISKVNVTIGRNAQKTIQKTLAIYYVGRRLNSKGELIDGLGTGRVINEFITEDGKVFNDAENEVTETVNDSGLSFVIDFDPEAKGKFPNAYLSYKDSFEGFSYGR